MIGFFRRFFQSKLGLGLTLAFLGLIAVAFASGDLANTGGPIGGVSAGDQVAIVGDRKIDANELQRAVTAALDRAREQNPTLTLEVFIAQGGMEQVLEQMIEREALSAYAEQFGFRASDRLIDSELLQISAFRGPDGNFDQEVFRAALARQGTSEADFRQDIANSLFARQMLVPATLGTKMPKELARRYGSLFAERRIGGIGLLPSVEFAPEKDPTDAQLKKYYDANRDDYVRPERRVVRFATFGDEALKNMREPTAGGIKARYDRDIEQYQAKEERRFTQLVVPTEAAARAILDQVQQGTSLSAAAQAQQLQTTEIPLVTKAELTSQASAAVANEAFSASRGTIATPQRGGLGWYVLRVDGVESTPARTLAQATEEIKQALTAENRRKALADLSSQIEDRFADGASLSEVAKEMGAEITTTKQLTADGRVYGEEGTAPEILAPALKTLFAMAESEPELAQIEDGTKFLMFDVSQVTEAVTAPLAEIKDQVIARWKLAEGSAAARKQADAVLEKVRGGKSLSAALAETGKPLPPPDALSITRQELTQMGTRVPPPLALFFSMAADTVKRLEAPQEQGWFIVSLDEIEVGELEAGSPVVEQTAQQLDPVVGNELTISLVRAIKEEMGVEINEDAVEALKRQMTNRQ